MRIHIKHYDWSKLPLYYCWLPEPGGRMSNLVGERGAKVTWYRVPPGWDRGFRFDMPLLSCQGAWEFAFDMLKRRGA